MRSWSYDDVVDAHTLPAKPDVINPLIQQTGARLSRRAILRGVTLSAATVGFTAISWTLPSASRKAFAESGPGGLIGWDYANCTDAYPSGYSEVPTSDGSGYPAACFGTSSIGPYYCSGGWMKNGTYTVSNGHDYYSPRINICSNRSAWHWSTGGHLYRCADGNYYYDRLGGSKYGPYFVLCEYRIS